MAPIDYPRDCIMMPSSIAQLKEDFILMMQMEDIPTPITPIIKRICKPQMNLYKKSQTYYANKRATPRPREIRGKA